jgi:hypothetical protein
MTPLVIAGLTRNPMTGVDYYCCMFAERVFNDAQGIAGQARNDRDKYRRIKIE